MTVCIAAIYNNNSILGASDRMVTGGYGDITFEPPISKILTLTNSIAVLAAGDISVHTQVFQATFKTLGDQIKASPTKWIDISEAAGAYSNHFYDLRNKLLERRVLSLYGLTLTSLAEKLKEADGKFMDTLNDRIKKFLDDFESVETIITGIDDSGPHIYVVKDGEISCHDKLGFAAIGIGGYHAISHFMLSSYSRTDSESKALLTTHQAKKKAEISPGVGKATDMCVIGPTKGSFSPITQPPLPKDVVQDLDKYYEKYTKKISKLNKKTEEEIVKYLNELVPKKTPKQEINPSSTIPSGKN